MTVVNDANRPFLIFFFFFFTFKVFLIYLSALKNVINTGLNCLKDLCATPADSGGRTGFCGWNASLPCEHIYNRDTSWQI